MRPEADVAIVGAGAAGLAAAIFAARTVPDANLVALDGARTLGAKILVSGGGRCNVTNAKVEPADFWRPSSGLVKRVLRALPVARTTAFFASLGVSLREEEEGKLFPDAGRARVVLDALLAEARARGVELRIGHRVLRLSRESGGFRIETSAGPLRARRVVLSTGGLSLPRSGSDGHGYVLARAFGHSIVPPVPALEPLVLAGGFHSALSGVALPAELTARRDGELLARVRRPLLFTHFGISGPAALDVSRFWRRCQAEGQAMTLTASLWPGVSFEPAEAWLLDAASARPRAALVTLLGERLPESVARVLIAEAGLDQTPSNQLSREARRGLLGSILARPLPVRDGRGFNFAEVTSGGVSLDEIQAGTLESRLCPGLHFAGEMVDVDGRLGGFNFQWAWSSGFVAGIAAARAARELTR